MHIYYIYAYLREQDNTPYYIGKGCKNRVSGKHNVFVPKDKSKIVFYQTGLLESDAFRLEIAYIKLFGRKNNGTGILRNRTDGGEGPSGFRITNRKPKSEEDKIKLRGPRPHTKHIKSQEIRDKISKTLRGNIPWNKGVKTGPIGPQDPEHIKKKRLDSRRKNGNFKNKNNNQKRLAEGTHPSQQKLECPQCGKISDMANAKRWHFDNCKFT